MYFIPDRDLGPMTYIPISEHWPKTAIEIGYHVMGKGACGGITYRMMGT